MADFAKEILTVNLEDEMKQSYLDYAMSVIVGRALPDARRTQAGAPAGAVRDVRAEQRLEQALQEIGASGRRHHG